MTSLTPLKWILVVFIITVRAQILQPCNSRDEACITKSFKAALPQVFDGIPSAGVKPSDPLFVEEIDGNLSTLKFKFTNTTSTGYKNCDASNVKFNLDKLTLRVLLSCRDIEMNGLYVISGRLIILPVEGKGSYYIKCNLYEIEVDAELKRIRGKDEKEHIQIKNFKLTMEAKEKITHDFKNLFNGNKELAKTLHKFVNENWKEVADFVQEPIFNAEFKKIVSYVNKYLKIVPLDEIVIQ